MNVWELSQEIEQFYRERRKILESKAGAGVQWGLLRKMLLQHFDEPSVRDLAVEFGVSSEEIEDRSFGGVTLELVGFILRSGQWELFCARLEAERPPVPWADLVSPFSPSLPLRQEELVNLPNPLQAALLLHQHFTYSEVVNITSQLDMAIDSLSFVFYPFQLEAVIICYLAGARKVPQLLSFMKQLRPHIPAIQQFSWEEPHPPFPRRSLDELCLEVKASSNKRLTQSGPPKLKESLAQNFSLLDLEEICFDAGFDFDFIPGSWSLRNKHYLKNIINNFSTVLENTSSYLMGKALIAGCASRAPSFDWAEAVGMDKENLPSIDSIASDGFYMSRIRTLLEECLPDNTHIFDFVKVDFPDVRVGMSINWPPRKNRMELIDWFKRMLRLPILLNVVEKEYPQQFLLFAPYSE